LKKLAYNAHDLTGKEFARLTVLGYSHTLKKDSFWECLCECGKIVIRRSANLRTGGTKSCGCYALEVRRIQKGLSGFNALYKSYIRGAIDRNLQFDLSIENFKTLIDSNCHYCNFC